MNSDVNKKSCICYSFPISVHALRHYRAKTARKINFCSARNMKKPMNCVEMKYHNIRMKNCMLSVAVKCDIGVGVGRCKAEKAGCCSMPRVRLAGLPRIKNFASKQLPRIIPTIVHTIVVPYTVAFETTTFLRSVQR